MSIPRHYLRPITNIGHYIRFIHFRRVVPRLIRRHKIVSILDAGCGDGFYSFYLATRYHCCIDACDVSLKEVKFRHPYVTYSEADLTSLAIKEKYDLIYCIDTLEHIDNDEAAVRNLSDALKNNGYLYVHVPSFYQRRHMNRFRNISQDNHIRSGYSHEELYHLLFRNRLMTLVSTHTCGYLGSLAWELDNLLESWPFLLKAAAKLTWSQSLKILAQLDRIAIPSNGNGLYMLAQKIEL